MMEEKKTYLTSELSDAVGVPRTTINDWLAKYGSYIDSEARGKRRVYGENAVNVLKEIAAMRSAGRSAFEIGRELESRYGVRPEIAPHDDPKEPEPPKPEPAEAPHSGNGDSRLPAARDTFHPAALAAFEEQMKNWQSQLEDMQKQRLASQRRGFAFLALFILILAGALAGGIYIAAQLAVTRLESEKKALHDRLSLVGERAEQESMAREKQLSALARLLDKSEKERKAELEKQKKEFEATLEKLSKSKDEATRAELLRLRDEFAARQKELLNELTRLREEKPSPATNPEPAATETPAVQKENSPKAIDPIPISEPVPASAPEKMPEGEKDEAVK